jgi:hypothetical protein
MDENAGERLRLVRTDYGIIREQDIPILIPDSRIRCYCCIAGAIIITILLAALIMLYWKSIRRQAFSGEKDHEPQMLPEMPRDDSKPTSLSFLLPQLGARYIYVYPPHTSSRIQIEGLLINGNSPLYDVLTSPDGMISIDLRKKYYISTIHIMTSSRPSNVIIRDDTGSKVFSYG